MSIILVSHINLNLDPPSTVIYKICISRNACCGRILQMYDRKIVYNGALTVCLKSLVSANHKQPFIVDIAYNCAAHVQMHSIFLNPYINYC